MRQLLMSRLIRTFTVCLVNLFFVPIIELINKQGGCPNLAVCPNIPDFTLMAIVFSGWSRAVPLSDLSKNFGGFNVFQYLRDLHIHV